MSFKAFLIACTTVAAIYMNACYAEEDFGARGFNDKIAWKPFDTALELAKKNNKPIMLLIHKSWCGACKNLKPEFAESDAILELSSSFVMTNTEDDEEPEGKEYAPDGGYIPRILFMDPTGKVLPEFYNQIGNPKYKYFYTEANQVVESMVKVSDHFDAEAAKEE